VKKILLLVVISVLIVSVSVTSISAQSTEIPSWVKGVANFWAEGNINDGEFGEAISFLIEQEIIKVDMPQQANNDALDRKISQLESENAKLRSENTNLKNQNSQLQIKLNTSQPSKTTTSKSVSVPSNFKLYDLLPAKNDLSSDWDILKSVEYSTPTRTFYYENAGQTKYDKDVNTIKEYRMNMFVFSNESTAKEEYDEHPAALKDNIGGFWSGKWHFADEEQLVMDTGNCAAIFEYTDYTKKYEHVYGYCLVGKYIIYQDITGYYPAIHDDFIDMMNIAIKKVSSVT